MSRRTRRLWILAILIVALAIGGYLFYRANFKNYVDTARMLSAAYNADKSDISYTVSLNGRELDVRFRTVKFPVGESGSAMKIDVESDLLSHSFYKVNGRSYDDDAALERLIPKNFMSLLQWGADIYSSDLEIERTSDGGRKVYTVKVPDDMAQSFMDRYLEGLDKLNLTYSDCTMYLTAVNGEMTELTLQGNTHYKVLAMEASALITVRAHINAVGEAVKVPTLPQDVQDQIQSA
ncbi:MAG: hypothetical protein IJ112_06680 [Oscillospiraceae bacterium]|nr:hypothetical protein [Oscillospiraceae bacterium]